MKPYKHLAFDPTKKLYVRKSKGLFQKLRNTLGTFFILLFAALPWLNYNEKQAILINLTEQQFDFFSTTLYPHDLILLAVFFIFAAFSLFFITTFLGRVWCGYLCPQTIWSYLFLWFEEKLEGAANKRRQQDKKPITKKLFIKKATKHLLWFGVSLLTALTFIGYFIPIKTLIINFFTFNASFISAFWVIFFTLCTYANAGWMRSIMCIHICPYARFQSVLFDKNTLLVAYDTKRGETRGARKTKNNAEKLGDCIDCKLCVEVCPTGIDIREGLQYECINCAACIDTCNNTMDKMGYPKGLIRYTSAHLLAGKKNTLLRPKFIAYGIVTSFVFCVFLFLILHITPAQLDVLRDRNQLFKINSKGLIENTYRLKIFNKTQQNEVYTLGVTGLSPHTWHGKRSIGVNAGEMATLPVSLAIKPSPFSPPITKIIFTLKPQRDKDNLIHHESRFIQ